MVEYKVGDRLQVWNYGKGIPNDAEIIVVEENNIYMIVTTPEGDEYRVSWDLTDSWDNRIMKESRELVQLYNTPLQAALREIKEDE